jgi:hypothetical protein
MTLTPILDRVFRSNPAYELISFDRLAADQQALLKDLANDPDFYGVLVDPKRAELPVKSVCRNSAGLIRSLMRPGKLPFSLRESFDERSNQAVAALVLDGILEIGDGAGFFSGADACALLYAGDPAVGAKDFLPRLSQAALEYAQALSICDSGGDLTGDSDGGSARLSMRLYNYNRLPLTPQWTRRLPSEASVLDFLGLADAAWIKGKLTNWKLIEDERPVKAWFEWILRGRRSTVTADQEKKVRYNGYKLYVSPRPEYLPAAFQAVVEALAESSAYAFKVGRNVANLLRPDKLVIYFADFETLEQTAGVLARKLSGCEVQGVPFTAPIGNDGLLSWGIDPAPDQGMLSWQGPESWRLWITNRLAVSLVSALQRPTQRIEPWQFALERLRLEEIDVTTWTPTRAFGTAA